MRSHVAISATYAYDLLILSGFYAAGYIGFWLLLITSSLSAMVCAAGFWAHLSGWSRRRKDPSLFLPQHVASIVIALGYALAAPQIGFAPFVTLLTMPLYGHLAPNRRSFQICWGLTLVGVAFVLFVSGPRFAIPTGTLAGRILTMAVYLGALVRCVLLALGFDKLRRRLGRKNQELHVALARIDLLANTDELTGVANRRAIMQSLAEQAALSDRTGQPLSIAMLDIDYFKRINDRFGHAIGDEVLRLLAGEAVASIRITDRLGRYGGEEFLTIFPATLKHDAEPVLQRLRERIALIDWTAIAPDLQVTLTAGVTQYHGGEAIEAMVRRADAALYIGKAEGRDRIVVGPPGERCPGSADLV
jgi:diguanylate cyclase